MKLLQHSKTNLMKLEDAYKQLGDIMTDVLKVLVVDKDQENYEQNYSVVWL